MEQSIHDRYLLREDLHAWIDEQWLATKNELLLLDAWPIPNTPTIEARRGGLERQLSSFEEERRREWVACWRDIELLKKDLRYWNKKYQEMRQRMRLLGGTDGK